MAKECFVCKKALCLATMSLTLINIIKEYGNLIYKS